MNFIKVTKVFNFLLSYSMLLSDVVIFLVSLEHICSGLSLFCLLADKYCYVGIQMLQ